MIQIFIQANFCFNYSVNFSQKFTFLWNIYAVGKTCFFLRYYIFAQIYFFAILLISIDRNFFAKLTKITMNFINFKNLLSFHRKFNEFLDKFNNLKYLKKIIPMVIAA